MRTIPQSFDPATVALIDARLEAIRAQPIHFCHIIESGSRAWGFPSPDSDYDCRFIYVRPMADYLSPWQKRDVIETPLEGDLDVNGWDLGKAMRLMLKGNAVIIEWLTSPIVYETAPGFRDAMLDLAQRAASRSGLARHYYHLGTRQWRVYFEEGRNAKLKKMFYALRPALALKWLGVHGDQAVPPMHFPTLLAQSNVSQDVVELCEDLIARKAITRELGTAPVPQPLIDFIEAEFAKAEPMLAGRLPVLDPDIKYQADTLFRETVMRLDSAATNPTR
jgi:uncharacterized protein